MPYFGRGGEADPVAGSLHAQRVVDVLAIHEVAFVDQAYTTHDVERGKQATHRYEIETVGTSTRMTTARLTSGAMLARQSLPRDEMPAASGLHDIRRAIFQ